jgi:hypothetical protein
MAFGAPQAAFTSGMTAAQINAEIDAQMKNGLEVSDVTTLALQAGVDLKSLLDVMITQRKENPLNVAVRALAAGVTDQQLTATGPISSTTVADASTALRRRQTLAGLPAGRGAGATALPTTNFSAPGGRSAASGQ